MNKIHNILYSLRHKLAKKNYVFNPDLRSESENGLYVQSVNKIVSSYSNFKSFKRMKGYQDILEHLTFEEGKEYLNEIRREKLPLADLLTSIKDNDIIGNPVLYNYEGVGLISPTTLRYTKVASDLKKYFGDHLGENIVEIGCGYGGQALILDRLFSFSNYTMLDLPPVLVLISKYLESHLINSSYTVSTINQLSIKNNFDLAISNYAFSELPIPLQLKYISKVLSCSKRGYLTMNSGLDDSDFTNNKLTINQLRELLPNFEVIEERPLTKKNNYIIIWGHR